ncbi:MAG TPA: glycosyltransferase, partial [Acidimicrobiales bacterium]|nr:glycosyltransferase [Acidimicrobiales bacterium]
MISRLRTSANLGGGAALFVALSFVNALNFVFHLVVARGLPTADYGALAAALGVLLVALVPINAFQAVVTAEVSRRSADRSRVILRGLLAKAWLVGLAVIALLSVLALPLSRFLHLGQPVVVVLIGFAVLPTMVSLPARSALLGTLRYRPVAMALAAGAAVRLGVAWYFAVTGRGVLGGVAASMFGEGTTAVVLLLAARSHFDPGAAQTNLAATWKDAASAVAAFSGFWLMTAIDTMLARHYLAGERSGHYAAAATVSKAVLFLPAVVALVLFPRFARAPDERAARRLLTAPLAGVAAVGLAAAGVLWLLGGAVMSTLYGDRYVEAAPVLGVLAVGAALLGVGNVLLQFLVARRRRAALLIWGGPIAITLGTLVWHDSVAAIAGLLVAGAALAAIALYAGSRAPGPVPVPVTGALVDLTEPSVEVTIVVPFFNAGDRINRTISRLCRALDEEALTYEVIAVSDGSTDGGAASLEAMGPAVRLVSLPTNAGKGQA